MSNAAGRPTSFPLSFCVVRASTFFSWGNESLCDLVGRLVFLLFFCLCTFFCGTAQRGGALEAIAIILSLFIFSCCIAEPTDTGEKKSTLREETTIKKESFMDSSEDTKKESAN
nr:hypothetical protein [Pandoravirus massiliensis]